MYQMIRVSALILLLWSSAWCADDLRRADEVCHQVDALMVSVAERAGVKPVTIASDAEFLRRVYLDLAGQVPSVSAARDFLASRAAEKRRDLVQQLLTHHPRRLIIWRRCGERRWCPVKLHRQNSCKI